MGHRNEINHILEPGYKSSGQAAHEDDTASVAGPSRLSSVRTAGGLAALAGRRKDRDDSARTSASNASYQRDSKGPGVYIDSTGRMHDTEYDPFAGVAAVSRRKSKRRSAFGGHQRRGSVSSGSSESVSDHGPSRRVDEIERAQEEEPEKEYRRRLEAERRQLDEVSGYAAARRRSVMSDRASGFYSGRATPSIRSGREHDDALSLANGRATSRLSQSHLPTSPTLDNKSAISGASSHTTNRRSNIAYSEESPRKHTETVQASPPQKHASAHERNTSVASSKMEQPIVRVAPPEPEYDEEAVEDEDEEDEEEPEEEEGDEYASFDEDEEPPEYQEKEKGIVPQVAGFKQSDLPALLPKPVVSKKLPNGDAKHQISVLPRGTTEKRLPDTPAQSSRVERAPSGATRITGFDAGPARPMPVSQSVQSKRLVSESVFSASSSRSSERERATIAEPRQRPKERPREQLFPETPAQAKKREERERRHHRAPARVGALADSAKPGTSSRSRILPEIEIVDDDDPRIIFPSNGPSTRIQTRFDHVIRTPSASVTSPGHRGDDGASHAASSRSLRYEGSSKEPSAIIEETGGGYLPSRWASGDRMLRVTEEDKDMYRPREWGGRHGSLGGRPEEWR